MLSPFILIITIINGVYSDCGWFIQYSEAEKENEIFGFGYCTQASTSSTDQESYMYDCINSKRHQFFYDNLNCEGTPFRNTTSDVWTCNNDAECNCVSATENDCQYFEYKTYPSSKCSGDIFTKSAQVLNQCFPSYDGTKSYKFDCETDEWLISEYSNINCQGSVDPVDATPWNDNICIDFTCKSYAYRMKYVTIIPIIIIAFIAAYW